MFPRPPAPNTGLPLNTRCKGYYRPTADLLGQNPEVEIKWTDDALWIVEPEYRCVLLVWGQCGDADTVCVLRPQSALKPACDAL